MSETESQTEYDLNWITSVDDHIIEPPDVWTERVPSKYKDICPRVITDPDDGLEYWVYEDTKTMVGGLGASAGRKPEEITASGFPYTEMRPGCYDAKARLEDMDEGGILASLNFPSATKAAPADRRACSSSFSPAGSSSSMARSAIRPARR